MGFKKYICLLLTIVFATAGTGTFGNGVADGVSLVYADASTTSQAVEAVVDKIYREQQLNDWYVADMAADGVVTPEMREFVKGWHNENQIRLVTDAERLLIAESAVGIRDEELADYVCENTKNAGINGIIFGLLALDSYNYDRPEARQRLVRDLLASQNPMGGFGASKVIDTDMTALAICALAPYKGCDKAVEKAVEALKAQQVTGGAFQNHYGQVNSNSTAIVIVALCAVGEPVLENSAFNEGETPLDGLLSFKNENDTFGFVSTKHNSLSTEQAFRAIVALKRQLKGEERVHLFRFADEKEETTTQTTTYITTESTTGVFTESITEGTTKGITETTTNFSTEAPTETTTKKIQSGGGGGSATKTITVNVSLSTAVERNYFFDFNRQVTVRVNSNAWAALKKALDEQGLDYATTGDDDSIYVSGVGERGDTMLSEFDMGANSGWKYSINGVEPVESLGECTLKDGDSLSFYYVTDYTLKSSDSSDGDNYTKNGEKTKEKFDFTEYLMHLTRGLITDIILKRAK